MFSLSQIVRRANDPWSGGIGVKSSELWDVENKIGEVLDNELEDYLLYPELLNVPSLFCTRNWESFIYLKSYELSILKCKNKSKINAQKKLW